MSISCIANHLSRNKDATTAVVAATVTNDERLLTVPKMTIVALHFTATARARIERAGGSCMTFDQLLLDNPTGDKCLLIQGKRTARKEYKYFGAAGLPHSKTRVKINVTGRKGARGPDSWWLIFWQRGHGRVVVTASLSADVCHAAQCHRPRIVAGFVYTFL